RIASPPMAGWMTTLRDRQPGFRTQIVRGAHALANSNRVALALCALLAILFVALIPVTYTVRSRCVVTASQKRYCVAPFEGTVVRGLVSPGDTITEGQILAEMDGRQLQLETIATRSELAATRQKRRNGLSNEEIGKSLVDQLESERLQSRLELLEYRQQQLTITSKINGYVLAGSLERSRDMPVQQGQVLFEIAPTKSVMVELEIPDFDVANVTSGQTVDVYIDGLEGRSLRGKIERVRPQSELREGVHQNVFVAVVRIDTPGMLRPGMRGSAAISTVQRPLVWNLLHRPYEYVISRWGW
ncbi:MAG: HlyD family efflux transporter periplasmic adaptor subunit, partial [Planctomycetota bacterium]